MYAGMDNMENRSSILRDAIKKDLEKKLVLLSGPRQVGKYGKNSAC